MQLFFYFIGGKNMTKEKLISKIFLKIKKDPEDLQAYEDIFSLCMGYEEEDFKLAHKANKELRELIGANINTDNATKLYKLYKRTLLFDAPYDFDSYLLYIEINRKPEERFYQPRRRILKQIVDKLQALVDDELDELFISLPPRVGKTTLLLFFVTWIIGRNSELSNLYSAYSDTITKAFYNGVLETIADPATYLWQDVFPKAKIVQTNSADETINIDRKKRYPSLTCRSLYGTLNGACDCNGFEISDDLIGGIEEAMNKDRLVSAWSKVDNNLLPRAKEKAKILWCGTRWSMIDPAGLRMELLLNDDRFKDRRFAIINVSALDENDESNFDYDYGVGFSSEYYRQRRASFERNNDMASWTAQYMGEPIEREGALFTPNDFRYYNGELPKGEPDRVFMAVDPAFGGGDFVASPVCFQYGDDIYVHDVVYSSEDKRTTQPLLANMAIKYDVAAMQIEANKSTESYKEGVEEELKKKDYRLNITSKPAPTDKAKYQRIFDKAPDIRENMIFRESGKRSKEYSLFMQNVLSYKMFAKNQHDDAPDSLTMAMNMVRGNNKAEVFKRLF
jgi:predicted phage terminase large subunit-like protein